MQTLIFSIVTSLLDLAQFTIALSEWFYLHLFTRDIMHLISEIVLLVVIKLMAS